MNKRSRQNAIIPYPIGYDGGAPLIAIEPNRIRIPSADDQKETQQLLRINSVGTLVKVRCDLRNHGYQMRRI